MTSKETPNLRHLPVEFAHPATGALIRGVVITHIRNGRWMIESSRLPKEYARGACWWAERRIILPREKFRTLDEARWGENGRQVMTAKDEPYL
jgi:hypothetical protein